MNNFDNDIKSVFLSEAKELLLGTEKCFLDLEKRPNDLDNLRHIFRLAHNLKGSSGAAGFAELASFMHSFESLLTFLKDGRLPVTESIVDLLLRTNDYLLATVDLLQTNPDASYTNPDLASEILNVLQGKDLGNKPTASKPNSEELVDGFLFQEVESSVRSTELQIDSKKTSYKQKDESIRVSLDRIEKLLNNVGELSVLQAVMFQQGLNLGEQMSTLMRNTISAMAKIIKDTQNISMGLRMLPIKQMFQKMERIVRDTSKSLGKNINLHLSGEETEIDKKVLEQLADPLVHLIRNAIDHGLEDEKERVNAGKPEFGRIDLSAFHKAGQIVIEIKDDGRGLDAEKIVNKAKSIGLIPADATMPPEQAYRLIFAPGFSTKDNITDVSGRGVGMDVVKTNISALQGTIEIDTEIGKGTCFRVFLPLTLAIIDSVIIQLNEDRYVVPLTQVSEFFKPREADITFVYERGEIMTLRQEALPILRLSSILGERSQTKAQPAWTLTSLIVRDGTDRVAAVLVDRIVNQQQVVIKPLGIEIRGKTGFMGSAILGDGKPAIILDLFELIRSINGLEMLKSQHGIKKEIA